MFSMKSRLFGGLVPGKTFVLRSAPRFRHRNGRRRCVLVRLDIEMPLGDVDAAYLLQEAPAFDRQADLVHVRQVEFRRWRRRRTGSEDSAYNVGMLPLLVILKAGSGSPVNPAAGSRPITCMRSSGETRKRSPRRRRREVSQKPRDPAARNRRRRSANGILQDDTQVVEDVRLRRQGPAE